MPTTYNDLLERLRKQGEITVMELLEITSEDLIDRFEDKIHEKLDYLMDELDEELEVDEEEDWN